MPWIDTENDLGAFVKGVISAPAPKQVLAVSEWMTLREWLRLWSSTTGVKARFEQLQPEGDPKDDPTGMQVVFVELVQFLQECGFTGNNPDILTPEDVSDNANLRSLHCTDNLDSLKSRDMLSHVPRLPTIWLVKTGRSCVHELHTQYVTVSLCL